LILLGLLLSCVSPEAEPSPLPVVDLGADREVAVGEALSLTVSSGDFNEITWYFGDGERADGANQTYIYKDPGHYTVTVTVESEAGEKVSDSLQVLAYRPAASVPPVWTSPLAVVDDGVWVVIPESGQLSHLVDGELVQELSVCERPRSVFHQAGVLAVPCEEPAKLVFVDIGALTVTQEIALPVGSRPHGVVGRDGVWWVSLEGLASVARYAPETLSIHEVGTSPRGVALGVDGEVFLSRLRGGDEPAVMQLDEEAIRLPWSEGPDSDTGHRGVPNLMEQLVISPDGGVLYVGAVLQNVERGMASDGQELTHETTLRGMLSVVSLGERREETARKQFDDQGRVLAMSLSPRGDWLYVSHPGTGTIHKLDAYNRAISGSILNAGRGINGLGLSADGQVLLVHAWLDRELRAYDVGAFGGNEAPLWVASTVMEEPLAAEVLRGKQLFYDSLDTRLAKDGYLACVNCHPDGRDDGQVWDFTGRGEGLRNTISLEGRGGTAMGPLHWSANFDEVQDFEFQLRSHGRGTGLVDESLWPESGGALEVDSQGLSADLDALAAYVASLTTTPRSPYPDPEGGEPLFLASGCADCHPAPLYTDSDLDTFILHDIGTIKATSGGRNGGELEGLDTPTLLGSWATAPYLHDGSAVTVEEAISAHAGDAFSLATLETLGAYVRSL
jgi:sugar lactone lactonase YvrE